VSSDCPIVVLDACVLYPAGLRSLLMWLAVHDLIRPKWTEEIHKEWMRNVLKDRPDLTWSQLERTRHLMDEHGGDCLVTDYEQHIINLRLPDMDDRHVLAAGIESGADAVITWNLADFPDSAMKEHGIEVQTPDQLIGTLLDKRLEQVLATMRHHRTSLKNPPKNPEAYLETLALQGLNQCVARLRNKVSEL
jgi:predicted nucleic acid-binding protein